MPLGVLPDKNQFMDFIEKDSTSRFETFCFPPGFILISINIASILSIADLI